MAKKALLIALLVIIGIGAGYGGLYYYAAQNLQYEVKSVAVDKIKPSILSFDVDLRIFVLLSSPVGINIDLDQATYHLKINTLDIGDGVIGKVHATKEGSMTTITLNATNIAIQHLTIFLDYITGKTLTIEMTIKTITIYGIDLTVNEVVTQNIDKNNATI